MLINRSILILFCCCCVISFEFSTQAADTNTLAFKFGLKAPLKFQVEETSTRQKTNSKILHTFSLTETNGEFVLKWLDVKFISVNGQSLDTPAGEKITLPARAMFLANPPMRISRGGEFLGTIHTKDSVDEINSLLDKAFPGRPEGARKYYANLAQSREGQTTVDAVLANKYWRPWVEVWLGLVINPDQSITNQSSVPLGGSDLPCTTIFTRMPSQNSKEIRLHYEQVVTGPQVGKAIGGFVGAVPVPADEKKPLPKINDASIHKIIDAQTNPDTLQPSWAKCVTKTRVSADGETILTRESNEYVFFWNTE